MRVLAAVRRLRRRRLMSVPTRLRGGAGRRRRRLSDSFGKAGGLGRTSPASPNAVSAARPRARPRVLSAARGPAVNSALRRGSRLVGPLAWFRLRWPRMTPHFPQTTHRCSVLFDAASCSMRIDFLESRPRLSLEP